jgi:hypothetical protein
VLHLVAAGKSNRAIASELGVHTADPGAAPLRHDRALESCEGDNRLASQRSVDEVTAVGTLPWRRDVAAIVGAQLAASDARCPHRRD